MLGRCGVLFIFFLSALSVQAVTVSDDFTTATNRFSGDAVWNYATGKIHPPLVISHYQSPAGMPQSSDFSISQGEDGVFDATTIASFGTLVGQDLTVDAALKPILRVKSFHLPVGYTITSVNGPLIIHSLSTVQIDGLILCNGDAGSVFTGVIGGAGGAGRCGGANGGNGGNATQSGQGGLPLAGAVSGGGGGIYTGASPGDGGAGGGGGGAFTGNPGSAGMSSAGASNTGGTAGNGVAGADHEFTILDGSPGGGGGSGSDTEGGSGGGGGGGTVIIRALGDVTLSGTGMILAQGGNGGLAATGGGGGGGGGGSVSIFTMGNFHLAMGTPVNVTEGSGGSSGAAPSGVGGNGSYGRIWNVSTTFSGVGGESHGSSLLDIGEVIYKVGLVSAQSVIFDSTSSQVTYDSASYLNSSGSISFQVAGSTDSFAVDDTGWLNPAVSLSSLDGKRYFRFRFLLNNSNPTTPLEIDSVSVSFTLPVPPVTPSPTPALENPLQQDFKFTSGGGCGRVQSSSSAADPFGFSFLLLPFILIFYLRRKTVKF